MKVPFCSFPLLDALLGKLSLLLSLESLVNLSSLGWLVAVSLSGGGRWLVVCLFSLSLALLLLGCLVELVGNRLLVSRVEVLVRVLNALLVGWACLFWLWTAVCSLVRRGPGGMGRRVGHDGSENV